MAFYVSCVAFKDPKGIFGYTCIASTETDSQFLLKMIFRASLYRGSQVHIEDCVVPKSGGVIFHKAWPVSDKEMAFLFPYLKADRWGLSKSTDNLEKLRREFGSVSRPEGQITINFTRGVSDERVSTKFRTQVWATEDNK